MHPQSIVHSLVEFIDGSVLAQLGLPDMRVPIAFALAHPERLPLDLPRARSRRARRGSTSRTPDRKRFPCLDLAYAALRGAEAAPAVLNAANEISVAAFLAGRIAFPAIAAANAAVLEAFAARGGSQTLASLGDVMDADAWARARARVARGRGRCAAHDRVDLRIRLRADALGADLRARARTLPGGALVRRARAQVLPGLRPADRHRALAPGLEAQAEPSTRSRGSRSAASSRCSARTRTSSTIREVRAHPSEALGAKPLWQKLAIVFAGPAMNLMLPVAIFAVTLFVGMPRPAPVIGVVEAARRPSAPGWPPATGCSPSTRPRSRWWGDFEDLVRSRPGETLALRYERGGEPREVRFEVASRAALDEFGKVRETGWVGLGHRRSTAMIGVPDAAGPAHRAGLRSGDVIVSLGGRAGRGLVGPRHALRGGRRAACSVEVDRGAAPGERLAFELPALGSLAALGVVPANVLVSTVEPDSPAAARRPRARRPDPVGRRRAGRQLPVVRGDGAHERRARARAGGSRARASSSTTTRRARDGSDRHRTSASRSRATGSASRPKRRRCRARWRSIRCAIRSSRVPRAIGMTVDVTHMFLRGLGKIVTGEVSRKQVAGPDRHRADRGQRVRARLGDRISRR